jgi:cytochrome P450
MTTEITDTRDSIESRIAHYDGYNSDSFEDNLALMAEARAKCPVARSDEQGGYWLVTRYEDARAILGAPQSFSSRNGIALPRNPARPPTPPLDQDGEAHRDYRRIFNPHLTPAAVKNYEDSIRQVAHELLAPHLAVGHMDAASDYANPFPAYVLGRTLLGLGSAYDDRILAVKEAVEKMGRDASDGDNVRQAWLTAYGLAQEIVRRRSAEPPRGDLISAVLDGRVGGEPIGPDDQAGALTITILGGLKTTTGLIGSLIRTAVDRPDLRAEMQDLAWMRHAFDEFMRMRPPISWACREATARTTVGDQVVEPGDAVMVHIGSANRDDAVFDDPDVFEPDRPAANRQLGFGFGVHRCVGAHLAKLEITVAVTEFVRALGDLRWQGGTQPVTGTGQEWSATSLPISFTPGGGEKGTASQA